jgi:hypothetical protein
VDHLPPATAAAFALTSKTILDAVGRESLKLEGEELLALLELLQPDLPNHLLCYHCPVFHTKSSISRNEHLGCLQRNGYVAMTTAQLLFSEAQQAMNNHLYGPRHPVGPNKIHVESRNHKGQIKLSEKSEMRVSGSLMLFKQQITWSGNWKKARNSKRYGKDRPITLCPHLRSSELLDAGYDV